MTSNQKATQLCCILLLAAPTLAETGGGPATTHPHGGMSCAECHLGATARSTAITGDISKPCRACHDEPEVLHRGGLGFLAEARRDCTGCHSFHEPGIFRTAAGNVALQAASTADVAGHCRACHAPDADLARLSDAHRVAARLYHTQAAELKGSSPSRGCLNCHGRAAAPTWTSVVGDAITFDRHASHPLDVEVVPGSGNDARRIRRIIDPRLPLFDRRITCRTCHDLTAKTPDLLVDFPTPKALCLGCHQLHDKDPRPGPRSVMATMAPAAETD